MLNLKKSLFCSCVCLTVFLSACTADKDRSDGSSPWENELQAAREEVNGKPSQSFVIQVLDDGVISDAEIEEAGIRTESCMHDRGYDTFTYRPLDQNFGELPSPERWDAEAVQRDRISCLEQTGSSILTYLWSSMRTNPQNIDPDELLISCLKKLKVVDESYSATAYHQAFEKYLAEHRNSEGYVDSDPMMAVIPFVTDQSSAEQALRTCIHEPQKPFNPI